MSTPLIAASPGAARRSGTCAMKRIKIGLPAAQGASLDTDPATLVAIGAARGSDHALANLGANRLFFVSLSCSHRQITKQV